MAAADITTVESEVIGFINRPEPELRTVLEFYQSHLARIHNDLYQLSRISFPNAAYIVEKSVIAHALNVDKLETRQDDLLDIIISNRGTDGAADGDAGNDDENAGALGRQRPRAVRKRKRVRNIIEEDNFHEIDNTIAGKKSTPDVITTGDIKFLPQNVTVFSKIPGLRKKVAVTQVEGIEALDVCRLRDYVLNDDLMLVREVFENYLAMSDESRFVEADELYEEYRNNEEHDDVMSEVDFLSAPATPAYCSDVEGGYSSCNESLGSEPSIRVRHDRVNGDVPRANLFDCSGSPPSPPPIKDVIITKALAPGETLRKEICSECPVKKAHKAKGKNCKWELGGMDDYFYPHVTPALSESKFGYEPLKENMSEYLAVLKENAKKSSRSSDIAKPVEEKAFEGFAAEDVDDEPRDFDDSEDAGPVADFELPMPLRALDSVHSIIPDSKTVPVANGGQLSQNDVVSNSSSICEDRMTDFDNNKRFQRKEEMGRRVARWHENLRPKLDQSAKRGAFNLDIMAEHVMGVFPQNSVTANPVVDINDLMEGRDVRDYSLVFLTCLQLTNEGNVRIVSKPPNSMDIERLRAVRIKEVDNYNPDEDVATSMKRKRAVDGAKKRKQDPMAQASKKMKE